MNERLILLLNNIETIKYGVIAILIILFVALALRMLNINIRTKVKLKHGSVRVQRDGASRIVSDINQKRRRDTLIIATNRALAIAARIVAKTPFSVSELKDEYMRYNLKRAGVRIAGGMRIMTPQEFQAAIVVITTVIEAILLLLMPLNPMVSGLLMFATPIAAGIMPTTVLRSTVAAKDKELEEEFTGLYLMVHHGLMRGGKTPIGDILKSYSKTTTSEEIRRFVDSCISYLSDYDEFDAMAKISSDYREVAVVCKMARLIRQLHSGAEIKEELIGFREELLTSSKYLMDKKMQKLIRRAEYSFYIVYIILVQAIISALAVFFPDLMSVSLLM